jgi:SRSO17 transposase
LLARVRRENGWQLAEAIGEAGPQGVQRLLNAARWDADAVRDDLRAYVVENLGDAASRVLIVDETSFLGPSAQVGVPREATLATKAELAKRMLARAITAAVPARWVVSDSFYRRAHGSRRWLEAEERPHVVGVLPARVVVHDGRRQRAQAVAASVPQVARILRSSGQGSQGERVHAWACVALTEEAPAGWRRWLLARRALHAPREVASNRAFGTAETPAGELVRVAGARWAIEEGLGQATGEARLDQYGGAMTASHRQSREGHPRTSLDFRSARRWRHGRHDLPAPQAVLVSSTSTGRILFFGRVGWRWRWGCRPRR